MHLARWPNSDWTHIKLPLDNTNTFFSSIEKIPALPENLEHAQVHILAGNDWFDQFIPVSKVDSNQNQIKLANKPTYPLTSGRRYYLQNIASELDAPGEWFYDKANDKILFIPPSQAAPTEIEVSAIPYLMTLKGANFISFDGLSLQNATETAIRIEKPDDVHLNHLEISNIGARGLEVKDGKNVTITDSNIHDTGEGGILLTGGDRKTLESGNNIAHNNHIHHIGKVLLNYSSAIELGGVGNKAI